MLGILKKKSEVPSPQVSTISGAKNNTSIISNAQSGENSGTKNQTELHAPAYSFNNPLRAENLEFKKIEKSDPRANSPEIQKILKRFQIGSNTNNQALLDKEGKRLMIVSDGPTAYKELCNNSWSNFFFGWIRRIFGKAGRNCVSDWEKEGLKFSKSKSDPKAKILEPMSHIRKALRQDHYKAVTMFCLDKETNTFNVEPDAVSLITQYEPLLDEIINTGPPEQVVAAKKIKAENSFKDWFCTDQYLVNPKSDLELNEITHNTCEAFFAGHGFKGLTVHYKVHGEDHAASSDLSYDSVPWKHLYQRNDESWKSSDDNHPHSKITVVRAKSSRHNPIPKELAYMHAWAQMALGRSFEENESNLNLINEVEKTNSTRLGEINQVISPNLPKNEKS
jgi:hypothetical protein